MERLILLALLVGGCDSPPTLVGTWTGTQTMPAQAIDHIDTTWVFSAAHTATRTDVYHYNDSLPSVSGCTETVVYTFTSWTDTAGALTIDNGTGTDAQAMCTDPANDSAQKPLPSTITLDGTYVLAGTMLTLTLNNSTQTFTRK